MDYKQILKGPLSTQNEEVKKTWAKSSQLNWELNACSPKEEEKKEKILKELIGEIGENTMIMTPFYCNLGYPIKIGKGCFININCNFLDPGGVEIGDYTLLGPGVQVYTANHPSDVKKRIVPSDNSIKSYVDSEGNFDEAVDYTFTNFAQEVKIGKRCWIGANTIILPGVIIGDNVVIGAGSVVTKDIPSNVIAVGSPARIIK